MVFTPSGLEQADTRFEGGCCPFVDDRGVQCHITLCDMLVSIIQIIDNMTNNHIARVLRVIQIGILRIVEHLVDPRHRTIRHQLIKIETGTEKACDTVVVVADALAHLLIGVVLQEEVDVPQITPAPAGGGVDRVGTDLHTAQCVLHTIIERFAAMTRRSTRGQYVIEGVRIGLQTLLGAEHHIYGSG